MNRLPAFYRALSQMGQAVVQAKQPEALYGIVCDLVVTWCGASMAWIGLIEGDEVVPCAWSGAAADYTAGLRLACPRLGVPEAQLGPTALALRSGRPYLCNDYLDDPRTGPFRARAQAHGVRSSAAFPLLRDGRAMGALNVYFNTVGAFDEALVDLLEQLVRDLCFALEHIDREAARRRAEQAARDREQQLAVIVETAMDAIISLDAQYRVVLFNAAAERMFGVRAAEVIGQPLDRFIPAEHREAHRVHLSRYASLGQTTRRMGGTRELTGLRVDGEQFPLEASISRAGEGDRLLLTVMARDVTQIRQAEKAQLARTAAEAANQAKTEFLSRISHELRTPLNAVLGFAQLLRSEANGDLSPRQREQLDLVLQAGRHLRLLIGEMLDISRIETGRMQVEWQDFELCELLAGAMRMCEPQAAERGVTLHASFTHACTVLMRSDPGRLRQVVLNLLSNAIKYNRPGGQAWLELERDPFFVHIVVRDNGLGMSAEQQAQLFQPFNRLGREHSEIEGTGIGLVLVRQLVGLLGGELSLDSREGEGTRVRVTLPAGDGKALAMPHKHHAAPRATRQRRALVLYVEDNPINLVLVEQLLSRWPQVQLVSAGTGTAGVQRARALQPDVVLLDMQLPDMGGLDVLRTLKAEPATAAITVVALSATAMPEDVAAARAAGAVDYWTKPIDFDAFLDGLARLLGTDPPPAPPPRPAD